MTKRKTKKLTLNKESLARLDPTNLREVVGGATVQCTPSDLCTVRFCSMFDDCVQSRLC